MKIPVIGMIAVVRADLLRDILEELADTPMMYKDEEGRVIDQTQRVLWTIQFIKDFARRQGLEVL